MSIYVCYECDQDYSREDSDAEESLIYCSKLCEDTAMAELKRANEQLMKIKASYPEAFARTITRFEDQLNQAVISLVKEAETDPIQAITVEELFKRVGDF